MYLVLNGDVVQVLMTYIFRVPILFRLRVNGSFNKPSKTWTHMPVFLKCMEWTMVTQFQLIFIKND